MLGLGQGLQKVSNTLSNVIRELREHWNTNTTYYSIYAITWESL